MIVHIGETANKSSKNSDPLNNNKNSLIYIYKRNIEDIAIS